MDEMTRAKGEQRRGGSIGIFYHLSLFLVVLVGATSSYTVDDGTPQVSASYSTSMRVRKSE